MSKLVRGDQLPSNLRREVLSAYVYRWTSDNPQRESAYRGKVGAPTIPLISDEQWLRDHAFYVTSRGELDKRRRGAQPAFMLKHEDHATKKTTAKLDREVHRALVLALKRGDKVIANGYPGAVVRVTPYHMIEVRLPGGVVAVSAEDVTIPGVSQGNYP